jgi:hypothetical protein
VPKILQDMIAAMSYLENEKGKVIVKAGQKVSQINSQPS